jgi:hypothetical protein
MLAGDRTLFNSLCVRATKIGGRSAKGQGAGFAKSVDCNPCASAHATVVADGLAAGVDGTTTPLQVDRADVESGDFALWRRS